MISLIGAVLALSGQVAGPSEPEGRDRGDITVSTGRDVRAASSSSVVARCGNLELQIASEAAGGTGRSKPETSLNLNGRALAIQGTALSEVLQRGDGLRKFVAFCGQSRAEIRMRVYSVRKPGDRIIYSVGSFTVNEAGSTIFHGEEQVSAEDFWFG